jgi:predicted molibdopterin-dependent oxidoreductase YjgC
MQVKTNTEEIQRIRKNLVEMMISAGNHDCRSCAEEEDCELRKIARDMGLDDPFEDGEDSAGINKTHPMIHFDRGKCISCWRCIQACNEQVMNHALFVQGRGKGNQISWNFNEPIFKTACTSCGECIEYCPTGALFEAKRPPIHSVKNERIVPNTCPYCGVGCQVNVHVDPESSSIIKVTGRPETSPNYGMLCVKGRFGYDFISSPNRLKQPKIREKGRLLEASWSDVLDHTSERLLEIRKRYGADAISGMASARDTNENNYAMMKFMRAVIGTNNIDHCART